MNKYEGVSTPWGRSQGGNCFMPGVTFYSTAGHGGLKVFQKLNREIPAALRHDDGWYEEDCDFAIPFYFLFDAISSHCLAHGLEGYTVSAEQYFHDFDKEHWRSSIERWNMAGSVLHFGTEYSDEQLKDRYSSREKLDAEVVALKRRLATPKAKPGYRVTFDHAIRFTDGREHSAFIYEGGNNFRTICGHRVRISRWKQRLFNVASPLTA